MPPRSTPPASSEQYSETNTSSSAHSGGGGFAVRLAAILLGLGSFDLALSLLLPHGFLRESELAPGARALLLCYSTTVLIVLVWTIGSAAIFVLRLRSGNSVIQRCMNFSLKAAIAALLFLYVLSWATFWQVGRFINGEAIRFWLIQPLQVFHWVDLDVGATVIALSFCVGYAIVLWIPRKFMKWGATAQKKLVRLTGLTLIFCLFWAILGEMYGNRSEPAYLHTTGLYRRTRDDRSTPIASLAGNLRSALWSKPEELLKNEPHLIQRSIVPIEKYVADVERGESKPWNVIVIIVESLRADQLQAYGSDRDIMPAVNSLARESRVFTNVRAQSSQTSYAVFAPLSSHYPLRSATPYSYSEKLTYPRVLIHNVLKKLGYRTAVFSSSNENWEGMIHYLQSGDIDHLFYASVFKGPTYTFPGDTLFANWVMTTQHAGSVDDRFTLDEAIKWIDNSDSKPFFIYLNLQNSHLPYRIPDDFPRRFSPKRIDFTIRFGYFPKDKVDIVRNVYADSLAYVDTQISRLVQHLRDRGLWNKTLVVVTGDHGQAFYEHGFSAHAGPIYDEVMRVPLIIRAPGLAPSVDNRLAQHIDVPPSVLALLGLPPHPSFQGATLLNDHPDPDKAIFMVTQNVLAQQYGIIRSHWKLIYDEQQRNYQLFDLAADPKETINLAKRETSIMKQLADHLHAWRSAQIKYYSDTNRHAREYPPIVKD